MEQESAQFEQQRQEIANAKAEAEQIRAEFENKAQELEGAWEQLKGEQQNLETRIKDSKVLDETQANQIRTLINALSSEITPKEALTNQFRLAFTAVNYHQQYLDQHWQKLEQHRQGFPQRQEELTGQKAKLIEAQKRLETTRSSIAEIVQKIQIEQKSLENKQESAQILSYQQQDRKNLQETIARLGIESGNVSLEQKLDLDALANMPLDELETTVAHLQQDLEKVARFVNEQEEELSWQCKAVEELETKIKAASEFDRLALEQELNEEKEAKRMLDETLVGQRRSLRERHEFLLQHVRILKRRQGVIDFEGGFDSFNLEPVKQQLQQQQTAIATQAQHLSDEIAQIQQNIQQLQQNLIEQKSIEETQQTNYQQQLEVCDKINLSMTQIQSNINFYEEYLQPLQNSVNEVRQKLEEIEELIVNQTENSKIKQSIDEINQIIQELTVN